MKKFPRYWHFVREIHRSPVGSPHKGQWREAQQTGKANNPGAGDLGRHRGHYDVIVMLSTNPCRDFNSGVA